MYVCNIMMMMVNADLGSDQYLCAQVMLMVWWCCQTQQKEDKPNGVRRKKVKNLEVEEGVTVSQSSNAYLSGLLSNCKYETPVAYVFYLIYFNQSRNEWML